MSRPSHAMQQKALDEDMAALPTQRWRWLFTPDPKWLAAVNTTTLREVNAVRMFVLVSVLWNALGLSVVAYGLGRCHMSPVLAPGETMAIVRRLCEESLATARLLDFAAGLFNSYGILLTAMAGVAVAAMIGKRATDTEHRVEVEKAKKAPVLATLPLPMTSEHAAPAPVQQTVNVGDDAIATAKAPPPNSHQGMDNSLVDDERGE